MTPPENAAPESGPQTPASERLAHPSPSGSVGGAQREGYEPGPGNAGPAPAIITPLAYGYRDCVDCGCDELAHDAGDCPHDCAGLFHV